LHYSIETTISSNNSLDATASVRLRAETGTERVLVFQLSRALTIDSLTGEHGESLPFFQNEGMSLQERSARGSDYLDVVLPQTPAVARNSRFIFTTGATSSRPQGTACVCRREGELVPAPW